MRKRIGILCVFLGILFLLSAAALVLYNQWEDKKAEEFSRSLLETVQSKIEEIPTKPNDAEKTEETPTRMPTVSVDGDDCIGILSVPALDLQLPVLTDWSYEKLKKAPCHYYGTYHEPNFVIAAHNYQAHFGRLSELQTGDIVFFTDVNGTVYSYEVVLLETLPKQATEEMITANFDLSLYTCTPGGASRVTARCNAIKTHN